MFKIENFPYLYKDIPLKRDLVQQKLKHNTGKFANLSCKKAISPAKTFGFDGAKK